MLYFSTVFVELLSELCKGENVYLDQGRIDGLPLIGYVLI
jgi:hypothetical protein